MKKAIVTTTINPPTKALNQFLKIAFTQDWHLFIVGDKKTPKNAYDKVVAPDQVTYLSPEDQENMSKELSDLIGWNCIQRRNFGLIAAYNWGAEIIATVDDDNIPKPGWGENLVVGKSVRVEVFRPGIEVFDPLYNLSPQIWHRGFPVQLLADRRPGLPSGVERNVLVQADLWDGNPDVDAICRIGIKPDVRFADDIPPFGADVMGPFNSQNTFLHRSVIPDYFLFPHIGRMDDIFAAYYLQAKHPDSVCWNKASVYQERNEHDLVKDLQAEMIGYRHSLDFIKWCNSSNFSDDNFPQFIPKRSVEAFAVYRSCLKIKSESSKRGIPSWLKSIGQ